MKKIRKVFLVLFIGINIPSTAQVGIGTTNPEGALDIQSTVNGVVLPRVTSLINVTNPQGDPLPNGTTVYDETNDRVCFYINGQWACMNEDGTTEVVLGSIDSQLGNDINGEAAEDRSGLSVCLSSDGSHLAISSILNDGNGISSGHVRVYAWDGSTWDQLGNDIDGEAAGDFSGQSVSLSADGSRLAIGADGNDGNGGFSGHVRVFNWNGSVWSQLGADINGDAPNDRSGWSVSLSSDGTRLAIAGIRNDGNGNDSGHVRVYDWDSSNWNQLGNDIDGEAADDNSGYFVSLSADGSSLAIGAPRNDGNGTDSGHVRVYTWNGSVWNQLGAEIDGEAPEDLSGWSVSLSEDGTRLAIGSVRNDGNGTNSGHVRVYAWDGTTWNQLGNDIDGEAAEDRFGWSVSLSADGTRLAIGANRNDGNGVDSGHVRLYAWDGMAWGQLGNDIDGEAADDESGFSVSLSADGTRLAIGAYQNDGNGTNSGHVRVYE